MDLKEKFNEVSKKREIIAKEAEKQRENHIQKAETRIIEIMNLFALKIYNTAEDMYNCVSRIQVDLEEGVIHIYAKDCEYGNEYEVENEDEDGEKLIVEGLQSQEYIMKKWFILTAREYFSVETDDTEERKAKIIDISWR